MVSRLGNRALAVALLGATALGCNALLGNQYRHVDGADDGGSDDSATAGNTNGGSGVSVAGHSANGAGTAGKAPSGGAAALGESGAAGSAEVAGASGSIGEQAGGGTGGATSPPCGNGQLGAGEACDDDNTLNGDGCSASCAVEAGWACDQAQPSRCAAKCGDGLVFGSEAKAGGCDDHNQVSSDGCSSSCHVEPGYACSGTPSKCAQTCGDGVLDSGESCDDQNTIAGDGCLACAIETGFSCVNTPLPSTCTDIDECASGTPCGAHSTCTNTSGSYTCGCVSGYSSVGNTCTDIDECASGTPCGVHSTCTNTSGSYTCGCSSGYNLVGSTCTDIDECASGTPCGANATCSNTAGSFTCTCAMGYSMVGGTCTADSTSCNMGSPGTGGTLHSGSNTTGSTASGYFFSSFANGSGASLTTYGVDAKFSATWNNSGDFIARVGLRYDATQMPDQIGTFSADVAETKSGTAGGYSYIGVYGWMENSLIEFYIIDDWFGSHPTGLGNKTGIFTVDGGTYDVYQHAATGSGSITGGTSWQQYFSVRSTSRNCGHIAVSQHFSEWASLGMPSGNLEEVTLISEVGGGNGSINFTNAVIAVH